jgi:hypothetical protein
VGGLGGAWAVGMAITGWRQVRSSGHLPVPAALLSVTGLFVVLGLLSDMSPAARPVIVAVAWGLDLAGLLRVLPAGLFQEIQASQAATAATTSSSTTSGG